MATEKVTHPSALLTTNPPGKISNETTAQQYWLYTPVQHPGYIAIHRAWYRVSTNELLSVEPQKQPLMDTSRENLIEFLQSVLAGITVVTVIDSATFKKMAASKRLARIIHREIGAPIVSA